MGDTATNVMTGGVSGMVSGSGNPIGSIDPIGSTILGGSGGGGGGSKTKTPNQGLVANTNPNLFNPYQQYMPPSYYGTQPILNPNDILNAYQQHMPDFLKASQPVLTKRTQ